MATRKTKEKEVKKPVRSGKEIKPAEAVVEAVVAVADVPHVDSVALEAPIQLRPIEGYVRAVGRRKTAHASARVANGKGITVNGKDYKVYFPTTEMQLHVEEPLKVFNLLDKVSVSVLAQGGGIHGQSEAVRHAISRALVRHEPETRKPLKKLGYLKRDPRAKERRKFGLKKARKAPQWAKR